MQSNFLEIKSNPNAVKLADIPVIEYSEFKNEIEKLFENSSNHCLNYFAFPFQDKFKFLCFIGNDEKHNISVYSFEKQKNEIITLDSITEKHFQFHIFEREMYENYGINFSNHPLLKPVRYPFNRFNPKSKIENYPFYSIESDELHEVGVGPIHAGVIEPGYFRFLCNGENVIHLEIHLGFQHRGIEQLFKEKQNILQQTILAESIAGDTTVGHTTAYSMAVESLSNHKTSDELSIARTIANELERIAVHIGDMAALCGDVAYQFGQVVCEALRTIIINTTQFWCGNRLGKGLIRPAGCNYQLTVNAVNEIMKNIQEVEERFLQITDRIFTLPSVLARFELIGIVTKKQAEMIGAVGMAARSSGLERDIRRSHQYLHYGKLSYEPVVLTKGDVLARALMRKNEFEKSVKLIKDLLSGIGAITNLPKPNYSLKFEPSSVAISLVEGWRGEICHCAVTDENGNLQYYKVKDPSLHNWLALALAVREQEISDFPLCNKSFNLSYSGNDL